jgi:hypothetical protein
MEFFEACIAVESSSFGSPDCAVAEHKPGTMKEQISSSCLTEPRNSSSLVPAFDADSHSPGLTQKNAREFHSHD